MLEGDIRGCYDNISHEWMLRHIPTDKEVLRKWLKAGFVENQTLFPTEAGTPQGGIISPALANLTLDGLERRLKETFQKKATRGQKPNPKDMGTVMKAVQAKLQAASLRAEGRIVSEMVKKALAS